MSEKDFIFKKRDLMGQLEQINIKLRALTIKPPSDNEDSLSWLNDAEYFLLIHKLQQTLFVDYRELLAIVSPELLQEFMQSILSEIHVVDKKIMSITFCNGITHKFAYKEKTAHPTREHLLYRKYEYDLLALLDEKKQVSRKDVEAVTGLGRASTGKLLNEFLERGIVKRIGHSVSTSYELVENNQKIL